MLCPPACVVGAVAAVAAQGCGSRVLMYTGMGQGGQPRSKLTTVFNHPKGAGLRKHLVFSESVFLLNHNHPTQTPSKKKLLANL